MSGDRVFVLGEHGEFSPGDRVLVGGSAGGVFDGWGTVRRSPEGALEVLLDAKVAMLETKVVVRACACAHGECDECQLARGEDPRNYAESASLVGPTEWEQIVGRTRRAGETPLEFGTRIHEAIAERLAEPGPVWRKDYGVYPAAARAIAEVRCECGSGSHVRGPGHSDWCKLYQP